MTEDTYDTVRAIACGLIITGLVATLFIASGLS